MNYLFSKVKFYGDLFWIVLEFSNPSSPGSIPTVSPDAAEAASEDLVSVEVPPADFAFSEYHVLVVYRDYEYIGMYSFSVLSFLL